MAQGEPMEHALARDFDRIAVPEHGKYVFHPATAENSAAYVTAEKFDSM